MTGKRAFDVMAVALSSLVTIPICIAVGTLVRIVDGSPVLYRQRRVGRRGVEFTILKFRTMTPGDPDHQVTVDGDSRITALGRILRRTKLDELPQLVNVLQGSMSLVGWRPEAPRYVEELSDEYAPLLEYMPGITDPASMKFRHESACLAAQANPASYYLTDVLPEKIELSLEYARRATRRSDLAVLFRSVV